MSRYIELNIPVDSRVPESYSLILAYAKDDLVRIPMDPRGLDENDHDCDWEGCSSVSHCLSISPQQKYLLGRAAEQGKGANLQSPTPVESSTIATAEKITAWKSKLEFYSRECGEDTGTVDEVIEEMRQFLVLVSLLCDAVKTGYGYGECAQGNKGKPQGNNTLAEEQPTPQGEITLSVCEPSPQKCQECCAPNKFLCKRISA